MEQTQELNVKRYLYLVQKRRYLFALVAALITTVAIIASSRMPPIYEAKTVVSVEKSFLNNIIKNVGVSQAIDDRAAALSTIMKSRTLLFKVIADLGYDVQKMNEEQLEGLVGGFQARTQISIEFNKANRTGVDFFTVSLQDRDPRIARDFVNTLVGKYIEENLSTKREGTYGANRFLLDQINHFKEKVTREESEIATLKRDQKVFFYDKLSELQKKYDDLLVQYTEDHPDVIKVKAELMTLKSKLRAVPRDTADDGQAEQSSVNKQAMSAASHLKNRLAVLERERDTDKKIYEELAAAYGKSEMSTQAEIQDKGGTFKIVDPAILPVKPISPNRIKFMSLGVVAGLAGAFGLIVLLDLLNTSVKSIDAVKNLGIPVLAVIPHIQNHDEVIAAKRKDIWLYGFSGLYIVFLAAVFVREIFG